MSDRERFVLERPPVDSDEWHALRRDHANASTAAVHVRDHEHLTIAEWFTDKVENRRKPMTSRMERGRYLEPAGLAWYEARIGAKVVPDGAMYGVGHLLAQPDGHIFDTLDWVEVKATHRPGDRSRYWQCIAQLAAIPEAEAVHLVEIGPDDLYPTVVRRSEEQVAHDIERLLDAIDFDMSFVEFGMAPPDAVFDADQVVRLWPIPLASKVELDERAVGLAHALDMVKAIRLTSEKEEKRLKDELAAYFVDGAEVGVWNGLPLITWKATKPFRRWDTAALERAHPELVDEFKPLTTQRRFNIVGEASDAA